MRKEGNKHKWPIWVAMLFMAWFATPAWSDTESPEVAFLDQLATQGIPAAYGQILSALTEGAGDALVEGVKNKSVDLAKLANQSVWRDKISRVSDAVGKLGAVLDIGGKIYAQQYDDAAVAGTLTILSELAATESGKAMLQAYGITPPMVTAVVVSIQIYWESHKALANETMGRQLQSLYGAVENMTRNSDGRTLGQGDPFPVTPENVEKVWRRILNDPDFRNLFRVYVTDQLQKTFPEPDFFDQIDIYLAEPVINVISGSSQPKGGYAAAHLDPSRADTPASTADRYEEVHQQRLRQQYEEIKPYVTGLVGYLNRAAKIQEQQTLARRQLLELKTKLSAGGNIEDVIAKIQKALLMSGVVEKYLGTCMTDIAEAAKKEDYQTLQAHMKMSTDYVRDVVAWLPESGPAAGLRKQLLDGLKNSYTAARTAFEAFRRQLQQRIDKPKPPEVAAGNAAPAAAPEASADPQDYYASHFRVLLNPFDWGGIGDPDGIGKRYEQFLQEGLFTPPQGNYAFGSDRPPLADVVEAAWKIQNFPVANSPDSVSDGKVPPPDPEKTIGGYKKQLADKINERGRSYPESILSQQRTLSQQGDAIDKQYQEGNDLYWGRNPKPPAAETSEQVKARRDSAQAKMDAAKQAGQALLAPRKQLEAQKKAWDIAYQMAQSAAAAQAIEAQMAYDAQTVAMTGLRAKYSHRAYEAYNKRQQLIGQLNVLALAPEGITDVYTVLPGLAQADTYLKENSYTHLGAFYKSGETGSSLELTEIIHKRAANLTANAKQMRTQVGGAAGQAGRLAEEYDAGCQRMDALRSESAQDIALIQRILDPAFLSEDSYVKRRAQTPDLAKKLRSAAQTLGDRAEQEAANMEVDASWLRQVATSFDRFTSLGTGLDVLYQSGGVGLGGVFKVPETHGTAPTLSYPYYHLLYETEKSQIISKMQGVWDEGHLNVFAEKLAPWLARLAKTYFSELAQLPAHKEENFMVQTDQGAYSGLPVTASGLDRGESIMNAAQPGTPEFMNAFSSLRTFVPLEINYHQKDGYKPTFGKVMVPEGLPLARRYIEFRNKVIAAYDQHVPLWAAYEKKHEQEAITKAKQELPGLLSALNNRIAEGNQLIAGSKTISDQNRQALQAAADEMEAMRMNRLLADPYPRVVSLNQLLYKSAESDAALLNACQETINAIGRLSGDLAVAVSQLQQRLRTPMGDAAAKAFYDQFKVAYESRDAAQVMRLIDDGWSAGDGTTINDLEVSFSQMFDLFDDIRFESSGLKVEPISAERVRCTYSVTITGQIYRNNLKHVEKSTVTEELVLGGNAGKILKTLQGSYWYIE